jgi:hypothetical protein
MRCRACDKNLTDYESTRKYANTNNYIDLCNHCFSGVYIQTEDRQDLADTYYSGDVEENYTPLSYDTD